MAAPPKVRRIDRRDLPDAPAWVDQMLILLNQALGPTSDALHGRLTFGENVLAGVKVLDLTTRSPVDDTFPIVVKPEVAGLVPSDCWIGKVDLVSGATAPKSGASLNWSLTADGNIRVDHITGLTASQRYRIRLIYVQWSTRG